MIEPLEQRIAPALAISRFVPAVAGSPLELQAGDMLSTSASGGTYLLFVEKGSAVVYTTDLNANDQVDFNEITGIAAGDGLRLISFVDIHGDIVTNLRPDGRLTDSDNDGTNGFDGRVLLNNQIEAITLRSLTQADLPVGASVLDRLALTTFSIFGNIYAGRGFGDANGGLTIDVAGNALMVEKYTGATGITQFVPNVVPTIGSIKVGTAASGGLFSFGTSLTGFGLGFNGEDIQGALNSFEPVSGQNGADINNIHMADGTTGFNLGTLQAGNGGFDGRGGNISNVEITGDFAGGYSLIAGNAGAGLIGKVGGSIINYSDLGSITSQVILQSGDGGRSLLGAGGAGGTIDLVGNALDGEAGTAFPINIAARLIINLGDGGDGLTAGGNGGSQRQAIITSPEGTVPFGLNTVSSTHRPGDIFNTISVDSAGVALPNTDAKYHAVRSFDFDLDGFNDVVYTSKDPDQLVVLFGSEFGFDITGTRYPGALSTIYLNGPANAEALTVGDFNGDGRPDIAAASQDSSFGGISVYLSQYSINPTNGAETFVGFSDPINSALPHLGSLLYLQKAIKITDLATGDFDGDGFVDLAISTVQTEVRRLVDQTFLFILRGDSRPANSLDPASPLIQTGYFFADFENGGLLTPPSLIIPPQPDGYTGEVVLKATALVDGGVLDLTRAMDGAIAPATLGHRDVLMVGLQNAGNNSRFINLYDYNGGSLTSRQIGLGQVDTNRDPGADKISRQNVSVLDFTVLDVDNDGKADIVALSATPAAFLVTLKGDGTQGAPPPLFPPPVTPPPADPPLGFIIQSTGNVDGSGDQAGIQLDQDRPDGLGIKGNFVGILTTAVGAVDGKANDITLVDYNHTDGSIFTELTFSDLKTVVLPVTRDSTPFLLNTLSDAVLAFDTYRPIEASVTTVGYALAHPSQGDSRVDYIMSSLGAGFSFASIAYNGYFFRTGDGGDSSNGKGGAGGQLGSKLVSVGGVITGTLNITVPANDAFEPVVRLIAGNGGDGYTEGGDGGDVRGVTAQIPASDNSFNVASLIFAGRGGDSIRGKGGEGGDLDALSIAGGQAFYGGDGGRGVFGGNGGSVIGNKIADAPDTTTNAQTLALAVIGGNGGLGFKGGGNGGDVSAFTADFRPVIGGESNALLRYAGGDGGNSLSGKGGDGGSVLNSSPTTEQNNLVNDVVLVGGRGGNGRTGGDGGSIISFVNVPGTGSLPLSVTVLAGYGGIGTSGNGGVGGSIRNVDITARGVGLRWVEIPLPPDRLEQFPFAPVSFIPGSINFGSYVAGEGGASYGALGGGGGSLSAIKAITVSSSFAVAAGKGGDGLLGGAAGGSVVNATVNAAAIIGKVITIAGDGGDVYGSRAAIDDPLAFGGRNGFAGDGGSISVFRQTSSQTTVVDLIAGNGGSTINFGTSLDLVTNSNLVRVGRGGSIGGAPVGPLRLPNIDVSGDIGQIAADVAIKSYNGPLELVSDFVTNILVNSPSATLDSTLGNVGLVVGATGRVKDNDGDGVLDPASNGINGTLLNVEASNIMSAVAGSVDRIASIQTLLNVTVRTEGAIFGADKSVAPATPGTLDYLDEFGVLVDTPALGGSLLDGAIIAKNTRILKTREFIR